MLANRILVWSLIYYPVSFLFLSLSVSGNGQHRHNWNGNRRVGGHTAAYHRMPIPLDNNRYNNYPNRNDFQQNFNPNRNEGNVMQETGCTPPTFTDEAIFEKEGCEGNSWNQNNQPYCKAPNSCVPIGIKVSMVCRRSRVQLRFRSVCVSQGTWDPPFEVQSCDELFALKNRKNCEVSNSENNRSPLLDPTNNGEEGKIDSPEMSSQVPCNKLQIRLTQSFILTCLLPGQVSEVENCLNMFDRIPSGTKVSLRCRPPYKSLDNQLHDIVCSNGAWEGNIRKVVCGRSDMHEAPLSTTPTTTTTLKPYYIPAYPAVSPRHPNHPGGTTEYIGHNSGNGHILPPSEKITEWPLPSKASIMCPALTRRSVGVELSCAIAGPEVSTNDCNRKLPVGTDARYSCASYFESSLGVPTVFRKCKEDGTWSGTSDFQCIVQCGRENIIKTPFITHSLPTIRGQWPWHAGIFLESKDKSWEYICGGTLVTKGAIVTAAHCVTLFQTTEIKDKKRFRVHMGKYAREDDDELVQIKNIAEIIVNPSYNPYSYESDVAIMIFADSVNIGYHVRPICFPLTSDTGLEELQLSEGAVGTVVGWGMDENGKLAKELRMAHLRVVGARECSKSMVGASLTQINSRSTSYCAGYQNSTNVCNGDSGGGMYFPTKDSDNTRWYLQGLVSVGLTDESGKCDPKQFSVFTRVGRYADFITRTLSENDAL